MIFNITKMPPKRMPISEAPVLTHATIEKLVAHSVATVLEAQAAIMASTNNPNSKPRKTPVARKCAYKKFTSYQLFYFNGPTSGIRATKGTLHKIEHRSKPFIPPNQIIMSAHDDFSLHDDEELSLHDDASLAGSLPASNKGDAPAKPPQIINTFKHQTARSSK
ncbi:hypothetical protein Tco_0538309, partial [Tanacetum coccineum]